MKFFSLLLLGLACTTTLYCPEDPAEAKNHELKVRWKPTGTNTAPFGKLQNELDQQMAILTDPPALPPPPSTAYKTYNIMYIPALPLPKDEEPAWEYIKPKHPNPDATLALTRAFDAESVVKALKRGADIDGAMRPALIRAVLSSNLAVARILLEYGANPNVREGLGGETALHLCVRTKNAEMANLLCEYGANPEKPNMFGTTATRSARNYRQNALERVFQHWYPDEEELVFRALVRETWELIAQFHAEDAQHESDYAMY